MSTQMARWKAAPCPGSGLGTTANVLSLVKNRKDLRMRRSFLSSARSKSVAPPVTEITTCSQCECVSV